MEDYIWLIAAVAAGLILVIVLTAVLIRRRKKNKKSGGNDYSALDSRIRNARRGGGAALQPVSPGMSDAEPEAAGAAGIQQPFLAAGSGEPSGMTAGSHRTQLLFEGPVSDGAVSAPAVQMHRIVLTNVRNPVQTYQCSIADRVVIGRNPAVSNLIIGDDAVSERHCEIELSGGRFYVKDMGSSNGTYVDGARISLSTEVRSGTILKLGRHEYQLTAE